MPGQVRLTGDTKGGFVMRHSAGEDETREGGEIDYDALDRARDGMDFEGLDDFLKDTEESRRETGDDVARIRSLEQSLEEEKRRLSSMEVCLMTHANNEPSMAVFALKRSCTTPSPQLWHSTNSRMLGQTTFMRAACFVCNVGRMLLVYGRNEAA